MKNLILSLALSLATTQAMSQWKFQRVDNGIDDPYKIAYNSGTGSSILKMENINGDVVLYITNVYVCDEQSLVEMALVVNGSYKKYQSASMVSKDHKSVYIFLDMNSKEGLVDDFHKSTKMIIRTGDITCESDTYEFSMSGSNTFMLND